MVKKDNFDRENNDKIFPLYVSIHRLLQKLSKHIKKIKVAGPK